MELERWRKDLPIYFSCTDKTEWDTNISNHNIVFAHFGLFKSPKAKNSLLDHAI